MEVSASRQIGVLQAQGEEVALHCTMYPCPPRPNMGQVLVQGAKMRKHGVAVFGQARVTARHVPRNTCCRYKPTLPLKP